MTTPRRKREWQDFFIDEVTVVGTQDQETLVQEGALDVKGLTLVRMILRLDIMADAVVASGSADVMELDAGIGIVFGTLPEASTNLNVGSQDAVPASGWLWRIRVNIGEQWSSFYRVDADIRSQRKLMYGSPRIFFAAFLRSGLSFPVETTGLIRCLYLLP